MAEKRSWSHRDDRPYDQRKRQRSNGASKPVIHQTRPNPASSHESGLLTASDVRVGLLSLLDQFVDEQAGVEGYDEDVHHARALHSLLLRRATQSLPSQRQQALERTRPEQAPQPTIPSYPIDRIKLASELPPLPPINEPHLKTLVFQHKSVNPPATREGEEVSYERLEFLGDAYIEVISTRIIYSRFPDIEVGHQAQLRETMVRNEKLALFANAYNLGDRIMHAGSENREKGWTKILADVFEAYLAAVVVSDPANGFRTAEAWLTELWAPQLLDYQIKPLQNPDAKNEISRLVGARGIRVNYRMEQPMELIDGIQKYYIGCYLTGWGYENEWLGSGQGPNKSQAGMAAATYALKRNCAALQDANRKKAAAFPHMMRQPENKDETALTAEEKSLADTEKQEKKEAMGQGTGESA